MLPYQPRQHQDDWREHARGMVGRQKRDERRRATHQDQGRGQRCLAAHPVAHVPEQHRTKRSRHEAYGKSAERGDQRDERRHGRGEKHRRKYQCRRGAIKQEVVPLDAGAGETHQGELQRGPRRRRNRIGINRIT
jgi:hypothetical protein